MKKKIFGAGVLIFIGILSIVFVHSSSAQEIVKDFSFAEPAIQEVNVSNTTYHSVTMQNLSSFGYVGEPVLPVKTYSILLPQNGTLESINITYDGNTSLGEGYNVTLGTNETGQQQNESNFNSSIPYPTELYNNTRIAYYRGYRILMFTLHPVFYIGDSGELYYYENMTVTINTTENASANSLYRGLENDEQIMQQMVDDYSMNYTYDYIPDPPADSSIISSSESYDYVIITTNYLKGLINWPEELRWWKTFHDLKDHKDDLGINTKIVTVEEIYNEPAYNEPYNENGVARDHQEMIRNFIYQAYEIWEIEYVLLGGDHNNSRTYNEIVPARYLCPEKDDPDLSEWQLFVPSDLYYGCLDGNYNSDEDPRWGEPYQDGTDIHEDGDVDLFAEVYIGRASVGNRREMSNFVWKTLAYEKTPANAPYLKEALMVGNNLKKYVDITWGSEYKEPIREDGLLPEEYEIDTLYDIDWMGGDPEGEGWPKKELTRRMNGLHLENLIGLSIINGFGHGNLYFAMNLMYSDILLLLNREKPFFVYSNACSAGAFDNYYDVKPSGRFDKKDSWAEFLTVKTKQGAFAVIANSRSGHFPGSGSKAKSPEFDYAFWDLVYEESPSGTESIELGKALANSKEFINYTWPDHSREVYYGLNLFGDPTIKFILPDNNSPTNKPSSPQISSKLGWLYTFYSSTTDPEGDQISYKWKVDDYEGTLWSKYINSSDTVYKSMLLPPGNHQIKVKSRDIFLNESDWSDPLPLTVSFNTDIQISSTPVVLGENVQFNGQASAGSEPYNTWYYDLGDGNNSEQQNTTHTYNTLGTYNVTLTVTDDQNISSNVSKVVSVVILKADFNKSSGYGKSNEIIYFNDTSDGYYGLENWSWDFGDGNTSYNRNASHEYDAEGVYNVSLTVTDNQSNTDVYNQTIFIDSGIPVISSVSCSLDTVGYGSNGSFIVNLTDSISGVKIVKINITYPDNSYGNFTMNNIIGSIYEYVLTDTSQLGDYSYIIWVVDNAENSDSSSEFNVAVSRHFGYIKTGGSNQSVWDTITGSVFRVREKCAADNITIYLDPGNATSDSHYACMIYRHNGSELMGVTEEKNITSGKGWQTFNFSVPKPVLMNDTDYVLACWADNYSVRMYYDNGTGDEEYYDDGTGTLQGHYFEGLYNYTPDPINFDHEDRKYSIYCRYSLDNTSPEITNVSHTPGTVGFGFNVTVSADVTDNASGVNIVTVNISYPDSSSENFTMNNTENNTYEYVFSDTWLVGQYNYTIWVVDYANNSNSNSGYNFNVSANATISVCTIKDSYGNNETINLTDPPGDPPLIGYELLDDGDVLHIWNKLDSYYFNTSSGIQLTNHKDDYWSHNVLMLGYYNNDQWNLIYRTDELSGFNKDIDTDNETYVNATIWKNLNYNSYDFRLAIRYHLGVDDNELTVIPYIKNLGQAIPYTLGFAWEINDIQVDMTYEDDYIEINGSSFYLNDYVDITFRNMTVPVYCWNETTNESYVCGYDPIPYFYIRDDQPGNRSESLSLKWDESLNYVVQVKSREGEYNAPVTLAFKIGTLDVGQEKYTELLWHDASEVAYYFDRHDGEKVWTTNPGNMVDKSTSNYASTTSPGDLELCNGNTCEGSDLGTILKVELRAHGYYFISQWDIILRPVFNGENDGENYTFETDDESGWSQWFDITEDNNAPEEWDWGDIRYLDCDVEAESGELEFTLYCSKVEVRVTYTTIPPVNTTCYFSGFNEEEAWVSNPEYMIDGDIENYASTWTNGDVELCNSNTCDEKDLGEIYKVALRAYGYYSESQCNITLRPVFNVSSDGDNHTFTLNSDPPGWSQWFDITEDTNAPAEWDWDNIAKLDCDVEVDGGPGEPEFVAHCSKVEIRVTYIPLVNAPTISNPSPANGTSGVSITPILNITVSDDEGDTMNVTWYSNSSGSWQVFGTNNSVGNGTYHQTFSNATVHGQWWYWKVNVSDGNGFTESSVYKFYTGVQSKIANTGSTNISGYLLIQVQYNNSGTWIVDNDTINETTPRTINASDTLALDLIFNGLVTTDDLTHGDGTYRVYAAFRDEYGDVLICDDESLLEAWYEFEVDTS